MDHDSTPQFNADAATFGGYIYTDQSRLSSRYAHERWVDSIGALISSGSYVLDLGCGDGTSTAMLADSFNRIHVCGICIVGVDQSTEAIASARRRHQGIGFMCADAHTLYDYRTDIALLENVLHHDDRPTDLIRTALRIAPLVIIVEPNGNNPILKIIERLSPYHRAHKERSFTLRTMRRFIADAGGRVTSVSRYGLVPVMCPDWMARTLRRLEPLVERTPVLRWLLTGSYTLAIERS